MKNDRSGSYLLSGLVITVIGVLVVHHHPWAWWAIGLLTLGIADLLTGVVVLGVHEALRPADSASEEAASDRPARAPQQSTNPGSPATLPPAPQATATASLPPRRIVTEHDEG